MSDKDRETLVNFHYVVVIVLLQKENQEDEYGINVLVVDNNHRYLMNLPHTDKDENVHNTNGTDETNLETADYLDERYNNV